MSKAHEAELVDQWNRERFTEMGFSPTQVEMLIGWGLSAHDEDVKRLVDAECPHHLVMRIVAPLSLPVYDAAAEHAVKV